MHVLKGILECVLLPRKARQFFPTFEIPAEVPAHYKRQRHCLTEIGGVFLSHLPLGIHDDSLGAFLPRGWITEKQESPSRIGFPVAWWMFRSAVS
jgi:hypothetical protein